MDSISNRKKFQKITYCISGDPTLPHHLQTLVNAQEKFGQPVTLALVLNVLKKDRLFSVEESTELAKKLAEYVGISFAEVLCLDTKEKVTSCLHDSDVIIRRKESNLDSNSPYILNMSKKYDAPGFPKKIEWIKNDEKPEYTSGRLKALVYNSLNSPDERLRLFAKEEALKFAPEFLVRAIEEKMKANPDKKHFPLSVDESVQKVLEKLG